MTPYEKTRIYSDYLDAVPTRTPQEVKDTIVKLASIMFEAEAQTVAPAIAAADPKKLADYLGIDQLVDQAVSDPSDESLQYIKDTVDSKLDTLAGNNKTVGDVGLKPAIDRLFRELVKDKINDKEVDAQKADIEDKLAQLNVTDPAIKNSIEKAITYAKAGNLADFQSRRQLVDKMVNDLATSNTGSAIDAAPAIDYLTQALADRGLSTYTGETDRELSGVKSKQLVPAVDHTIDLVNKKIAQDQEFDVATDEMLKSISDTANAIKAQRPDADTDGLIGNIKNAIDLVKSYQGGSDDYNNIKKNIEAQVMSIDAKRDGQSNVNIGVDYTSVTNHMNTAIDNPADQATYDALLQEVSTLDQKIKEYQLNIPARLKEYTEIVVEKGRQKDPSYADARKYLDNQVSLVVSELYKVAKRDTTGKSNLGAVKPLVEQLFNLLDAKISNDKSDDSSIGAATTGILSKTDDDGLINMVNREISPLIDSHVYNDQLLNLLQKLKDTAAELDKSTISQMQNLSSQIHSTKQSNMLGDQIKSAFAKLYNLGQQQQDTATRAKESTAARTQDNQVNQILGFDELVADVGKVPADELEAKLNERLAKLKETVPVSQIDIGSIGAKVDSIKQDYNVEIVQANEAANKARDEYNNAQRTLDENVPANWDKLDTLRKDYRAKTKKLNELKNKLDTINKVFDFSNFNREISDEKTTQQSFALRSKEDELRKDREAYHDAQHQSTTQSTDGSLAATPRSVAIDPSVAVKAIQETLVRMVANKSVRESYNNMIASIKKANGERKQLRSTDPSADVKAIRAASFSEGTLVDNGVCSCYKLGGADNAPTFPVFPFSELFGANPKAIVSYDEGANLLSIKERTLNMSDGTQRPGSWEIQITADESGAYADVSVPNDPKNPADGYNMVNAASADLASLNVRGARPKFLSDAFNELAKNNPRMQI